MEAVKIKLENKKAIDKNDVAMDLTTYKSQELKINGSSIQK